MKLSLFVDDNFFCVENPKESKKKKQTTNNNSKKNAPRANK